MKRCVALAPAYPPLSGDPATAAPLLITTTRLPGRSGLSRASRSQWNAIWTSVSQLTENVSQVCCCSGRMLGRAPATTTTTSGSWRSRSLAATVASRASAISGWIVPAPGNSAAVRDTAMTGAPAAANAVAIPRPRPRLAPTTMVVLPDRALIVSSSVRGAGRRDRLQPLVRCRSRPAQEQQRQRHADPGEPDAGHEGGLEALGQRVQLIRPVVRRPE